MPKITPVDLLARKRERRKITMLPGEEHTYHIDPAELAKLEATRKRG